MSDGHPASLSGNSGPPLITLTTDFGLSDTYVGVMKGVVLGIAPQARLVDLTHDIAPQNLLEASARLEAAVDYFPAGAIHLVVVDPGVGTDRAAIVVQTDASLFVAPNNGVLTLPLRRQAVRLAVRLTAAAHPYLRHPVSATFQGRDVFAPVAAHLATGLRPTALGDRCAPEDLVTLPIPQPQAEHDAQDAPALRVPILYADRFGNLITALTPEAWTAWQRQNNLNSDDTLEARITVQAGERRWQGLARTFASVAIGSPLAYWGSAGRLEIAIRNGNAARILALSPGETILLIVQR